MDDDTWKIMRGKRDREILFYLFTSQISKIVSVYIQVFPFSVCLHFFFSLVLYFCSLEFGVLQRGSLCKLAIAYSPVGGGDGLRDALPLAA